jgi:hypothetical protein
MIYLVTAILLIFVSHAAALLIIKSVDITRYVDIMDICRVLDETTEQCTSSAIDAGWIGCLSAVILLVLLILTYRRFPPSTMAAKVGSRAFVALAPLVTLIVGFIYWAEIFSSHSAARAAALSLDNLIWPLCLQLANNAITTRWRILFLSLLAPLVAVSPFRGVILAVAIFGIALPVVEREIAHIRSNGFRSRRAAIYLSLLLIGVGGMTAQLVVDTQKRPTSLRVGGGIIPQLVEKLGQRVAMPLYQAHLAQAHDLDQQLPSISDELLTKLRLRRAVGINGYLYAMLHDPMSYGETTSLYFGEAALRTIAPPLIWCVVAPFMLILLWALLRRFGYATATLIGIAIWRGSLGGIVAIVPALTFQLALFMLLMSLFEAEKLHGR